MQQLYTRILEVPHRPYIIIGINKVYTPAVASNSQNFYKQLYCLTRYDTVDEVIILAD